MEKNYNDDDDEATLMYHLLHLPSRLTLCDSSNCSYLIHLQLFQIPSWKQKELEELSCFHLSVLGSNIHQEAENWMGLVGQVESQ